ncbi:MAG: amidohydrolase family protein [Terriglobales bacterium]
MYKLKTLAIVIVVLAVAAGASAQLRPQFFMPQGQPAAAPPTALIEAGTVLDGHGHALHDTRILVRDGKIAAIGPDLSAPGAVVYDLRDATVMPGLIDVHVHLTRHFGPNGKASDPRESPVQNALGVANNLWVELRSGVTTVQSVGEQEDVVLKQYVQNGVIPGPRVITSIQDIYGSPDMGGDDVLLGRVAILHLEHAGLVKIFASDSIRDGAHPILTLHQLQVLCGEANKLGMRTLVHAYRVSVHNATVAGCTEVEHGTFGTQADLDLMAKNGTYFDPQVGVVIQNYVAHQKQFMGEGDYDPAGFQRMQQAVDLNNRLFQEAIHTPGLKVVMGTDSVAGAFGHAADELLARIRDGQSAMDAIDGATALNAESLRMGSEIGSIQRGLQADIIAVSGDPLTDPSLLQHVSFVMKGGTVYKDYVSAPSSN